jgi:SHS2 domain-containing protein
MTSENAQGFIEIDHTADIALRVWATSLSDLFKLSVDGMNRLIEFTVYESDHSQREEFCIEGIDLEALLVSLLNECNYKIQLDHVGSKIAEISVENEKITGMFFHQKIESFDMEIKAVTYHNLKIRQSEMGYVVDIVFDV